MVLREFILLVTTFSTRLPSSFFHVFANMDLSDQELCIALEEFERTIVDVSDLFLSLLENRLLNLERCDLQCLLDLQFKYDKFV